MIEGRVALVTGASGGIGSAVVRALLQAGAREVIASSRTPPAAFDSRIKPLAMDVTSARSVLDAAAALGSTVDLVINVCGVNTNRRLPGSVDVAARHEMETNYFGLMNVFEAFAPGMMSKKSGAFVNVLSVLAHVSHPQMATYSASKAASYSLTQAMRAELSPYEILVVAVMPPVVDTDMSKHIPSPKMAPAEVAAAIVHALEAGVEDVYPGAAAKIHEALLRDSKALERSFAARISPL